MTRTDRPRVIWDCNVLLQSALTPGGPGGDCLGLVRESRVLLLLSPDLLREAHDVLTRPFVRVRVPQLTPSVVEILLRKLRYSADISNPVPHVVSWPRDPKDEPYLNLAIEARAEYLVTRDADLLDLPSDHSIEAKQFRQATKNAVKIVKPWDFLRELGR